MRAALAWPDGTVMVLPLGGAGWLDTTVFVDGDAVGPSAPSRDDAVTRRPAVDVAALLGTDEVVVAGRRTSGVDLVADLLRQVWAQADVLVAGGVAAVTVAAPAGWGPRRLL